MNRFALLALLVSASCLFSQSQNADTNVYVTNTSFPFATHISSFNQLDFANSRAVDVDSGVIREQLVLKNGRGKTKYGTPGDLAMESTEVRLVWQRDLDTTHRAVAYDWFWIAGSSSQSEIVQIFELRDGKVFIVQQIDADQHHGGNSVGTSLDSMTRRLTVKSVELNPPGGRCCPRFINVLVFDWTGKKFRRLSVKRAPLGKDR